MYKAYTSLAKYYDLIFSSKRYPKESSFIKKNIQLLYPQAKKILDVGCGTGVHLNLLKDSFEVLQGIDLNKEIIEVAKSKSNKINYQVGSMADFDLKSQFDVLLCLYSVFNYNLTRDDAMKTLTNFKKHLAEKGIIIVALYKPTNTNKEMSIHAGKNDQIEIAKINYCYVDSETQMEMCDFVVHLKENEKLDFFVETNHKFKLFGLNEVEEMFTKSGFKNIKVYDGFTDKPAAQNTEYPVVVAQA